LNIGCGAEQNEQGESCSHGAKLVVKLELKLTRKIENIYGKNVWKSNYSNQEADLIRNDYAILSMF
jgi:hypothetical protein